MPKAKKASVPARQESARYKNHAYMNPDGTVDGEKLLALVTHSPGGLDLIMLGSMVRSGIVGDEYYDVVREIVGGLFSLVMLAKYGDKQSATQIKAIQKLVYPNKYELPLSKIR